MPSIGDHEVLVLEHYEIRVFATWSPRLILPYYYYHHHHPSCAVVLYDVLLIPGTWLLAMRVG